MLNYFKPFKYSGLLKKFNSTVKPKRVVSFHYTLKDKKSGEILDATMQDGKYLSAPFVYLGTVFLISAVFCRSLGRGRPANSP